MRRFLLGATAIVILLVITGTGVTAALAVAGPLHPGDTLFPWQSFAEQSQGKLFITDLGRAHYFISIAGRRADNLGVVVGTANELISIYYLNQSLDQAALSISKVETGEIKNLRVNLGKLVLQIRQSLAALEIVPVENPDVLEAFYAKINSLEKLIVNPEAEARDFAAIIDSSDLSSLVANNSKINLIDDNAASPLIVGQAYLIPFPANSPGAQHEFFPLTGEHAVLACQSCHTTDRYRGTANTCEACHANITPANHYLGSCQACHTPISWQDITFDHMLVGATDCQSCHNNEKPANHYGGQCAVCHSTSAWLPASFNHTGQTDCQSCHSRPSGHYNGQCSQCHSTSNWLFNHGGNTKNCQSCHSNTKPANHFNGQCSTCHSTSAWLPANFSHTGQSDCQACHSRPSGHYSGQCSKCHATSSWGGASGHFAGADCQSCHTRPSEHAKGQCSQCHNTKDWDDATGHFAGADCKACHTRPSKHPKGQCSKCHSTKDWDDAKGDDDDDDD